MTNETSDKKPDENYDYRFLDYRLDQLERKIDEGMGKLEARQTNNYQELIKMLQLMQEGNNKQNQQLVEIQQRQQTLENQIKSIDNLKDATVSHKEQINNIYHRLGVYQKIFIILGTATATSLITALFNIITK